MALASVELRSVTQLSVALALASVSLKSVTQLSVELALASNIFGHRVQKGGGAGTT